MCTCGGGGYLRFVGKGTSEENRPAIVGAMGG